MEVTFKVWNITWFQGTFREEPLGCPLELNGSIHGEPSFKWVPKVSHMSPDLKASSAMNSLKTRSIWSFRPPKVKLPIRAVLGSAS